MSDTEQSATEQLLALEQAREARRIARNRRAKWAGVVLVVALVAGVPIYIHQRNVAEQEQVVQDMFNDMIGN